MSSLKSLGITSKVDDSSVSIGKRYSRNDELGTSFAVTIDFQSCEDQKVTIRERDSTEQIRVEITEACHLLDELVNGKLSWNDLRLRFDFF